MKDPVNHYFYLANETIAAKIYRGCLLSLQTIENGTEFVKPSTHFSAFEYHLSDAEPNLYQATHTVETVHESSEGNAYKCITKEDGLEIETTIELSGHHMKQHVCLRNVSDRGRTIDGLRIICPSNSNFQWGDDAGAKILSHVNVCGHGSHMIYNRCDGGMPALVAIPVAGKSIDYFDMGNVADDFQPAAADSSVYLYFLSGERKTVLSEKGSNYPFNPEKSEQHLKPGEKVLYGLLYAVAASRKQIRSILYDHGLATIDIVPGYTVPKQTEIKLLLRSLHGQPELLPNKQGDSSFQVRVSRPAHHSYLYKFFLPRFGENHLKLQFSDNREIRLVFYATKPLSDLIDMRAAFIASKQVRNPDLWYDGLLCEWNNKTDELLTPDNYDEITGWRVYAVTCDDPGLSKPAFLSSKQVIRPKQSEIEALDYYLDNFVWRGLQMADDETYPYGIYGIPDWKHNRDSASPDVDGKAHVWRIYDYPHLILTYYNLFYVAKNYPYIKCKHDAHVYLDKAYHSCIALFTIPAELVSWSAYETGLYNELILPKLIEALEQAGCLSESLRVQRLWDRKVRSFLNDKKDIFASEYPFDTTGFESTQALANRAIELSVSKHTSGADTREKKISYPAALSFMHRQAKANLACRGIFESSYYWYGSDYRGNNFQYTMSYMSQMGGQALLDYALYSVENFAKSCELIRYAYGSLQSSWALINSYHPDRGEGLTYNTAEQDGSACGGFEPQPFGRTWLGPRHQHGRWQYSCEIDLGFCGALRGAALILVDDPLFGLTVYGGSIRDGGDRWFLSPEDGVSRRLHVLSKGIKMHFEMDAVSFSDNRGIQLAKDLSWVHLPLSDANPAALSRFNPEQAGLYNLKVTGTAVSEIKLDQQTLVVNLLRNGE